MITTEAADIVREAFIRAATEWIEGRHTPTDPHGPYPWPSEENRGIDHQELEPRTASDHLIWWRCGQCGFIFTDLHPARARLLAAGTVTGVVREYARCTGAMA